MCSSDLLVNKGLELIEAHLLFDVAPEHVLTVVHPQSIVHSMVTWIDGATTLQASPPDMRLPIALGLSWPERLEKVEEPLTWGKPQSWTFEAIDETTFPAVNLARSAVAASATHPAVFNWDTHGLPVEISVEKELGLKSKKEIEEYGVEKFNKKCRDSLDRKSVV